MSIDETASWCEMVGNAADDVLELEIDDMDIVENGEPNDKIEAEETQRTAILIVVHSNFRTYGGPRTREVSPDDIVGLFVGDVDTGRGHIFRISPHRQQPIPPQDRRARLSRAKSIYRDKFFNERNLVPFDSVETHMVDSVGCMLQLAAQFLAPYSTIYVKLPPQVRWVLRSLSTSVPCDLNFTPMPRHARASRVLVHQPTCCSRPNHNSVVCEICLFHCYRDQIVSS